MYVILLVNYGALMLKALFEHWPQVNVDSEEKPNGASSNSNSQVVNTHTRTRTHTHTHTHTHNKGIRYHYTFYLL